MYAFDYHRPDTLDGACALLSDGRGRALAGGQTLLGAMKLRLSQTDRLVDLSALAELRGIEHLGTRLRIGAMMRHAEVAASPVVHQHFPALSALAEGIGDVQVRNMGTLGGSVANNDPSACYPSALVACAATVRTTAREISADDFFNGFYATALEDGELIRQIDFPIPLRAAYVKFRQPASRFALIGVFVAQTNTEIRVAVTGGGSGVFRAHAIEQALQASLTPASARSVCLSPENLASDIHATASYRAHLISILAARAVEHIQSSS